MPDFLHQLHQGLLVHLLNWSIEAAGADMVDTYFQLMPIAEGMRHFAQGVTSISQWTGRESKEVAKQLLPVIACLDARPWDMDFVRLARAVLDFIYRAQASRMTEDDVVRLERTLDEVHQYKGVLVRLNVFQNDSRFDAIAKLHMASHVPNDTRQMGTPDGFSTETPEHQHIESKHAWRASNKVRPTPQMIKFLQRYEALRMHRARMNTYLGRWETNSDRRRKSRVVLGEDEDVPFHPSWEMGGHHEATGRVDMGKGIVGSESGGDGASGDGVRIGGDGWEQNDEGNEDEGEDEEQQEFPGRMRTAADARGHVVYPNPTLSIALKPTAGRVRGIDIISKHEAVDLISALHVYLNVHGTRRLPPDFLPTAYHEYPVWHRLYLRHAAPPFDPEWPRRDVIRARPSSEDQESSFDVALLLYNRKQFGIHRKFSRPVLGFSVHSNPYD